MKYSLYETAIEVTRKCNMDCAHCLRGEAQNINIDNSYIDKFLEDVDYIGSIVFTGGEPSLNIDAIEHTLNVCKECNITVGSFYIVTNAKANSEKLAIAALKWYAYCDEKDICGIAVSKDMFHDYVDDENIELLQGLSFFSEDKYTDFNKVKIINEGRAQELGGFSKTDAGNWSEFSADDSSIETMVYLSANGDIRTNCNIAYENDDYTIGSLKDNTLSDIFQAQMEKDHEALSA